MTLSRSPSNGSLRLASPRPEHAAALRRLAFRLGEDPDAQGEAAAPPSPALAETLSADKSRRLDAALAKCAGLREGREVARQLLEMAAALEALDEVAALQEALGAAREKADKGCACPHRSAGFADVFNARAPQIEKALATQRARLQKAGLLAGLRELLADEIDEARGEGAPADEAAQLLLERRDLLGDLPVTPSDLAEIGRSIAEEAAPDPELAAALRHAATQLEEARP